MTRQQATKQGKALFKQVRLKGKTLRVHGNIGWHYCVQASIGKVHITVSPIYGGNPPYYCMLGQMAGSGEPMWTDNETFSDPNDAIAHTLKRARKHVNILTAFVEMAESMIEKTPKRKR